MGYGRDVYDAAINELNDLRTRELAEADEKKSAFYLTYPRAAEINRLLSSTAVQAARAVFSGGNTADQLSLLKDKNLSLQAELKQILHSAGLSTNYLQPHYECTRCEDKGFIDGRMCVCFKDRLRKQAYQKLNRQTPLSLSTFDSFSLKYYPSVSEREGGISPKKQMENVLNNCLRYAEKFSSQSDSLLFQGGTGLGKTHLSLAIANEVLKNGFGVLYGSTQNMATNLEKERFSRERENDTNRLLLGCDLLILDDLGTEFSTSFVDASIYNIINTRLMTQKPTIISTNLSIAELQKRYSERFVSRIIGSFIRVPFSGKDVRQQRRMER